ncbi:MAG: hypothetical protein RSA71_13030, partial [Eubacterium sp.]
GTAAHGPGQTAAMDEDPQGEQEEHEALDDEVGGMEASQDARRGQTALGRQQDGRNKPLKEGDAQTDDGQHPDEPDHDTAADTQAAAPLQMGAAAPQGQGFQGQAASRGMKSGPAKASKAGAKA